jgi:acetyl-CoA C-acetyltransferase
VFYLLPGPIRRKKEDLDLVEANEAFAAQACAVNKDLG